MTRFARLVATVMLLVMGAMQGTASAPVILINHVGYGPLAPKRAVIRSSPEISFSSFVVRAYPTETVVFRGIVEAPTAVDQWRNWRFRAADFSDLRTEGIYFIECQDGDKVLRSAPFVIQKNILERRTLSDVIFYFKGRRCSGAMDQADRNAPVQGDERKTQDAHGGWYDASGDYGKHLSHLNHSTFFNPQQTPMVVYSLFRTLDSLQARGDRDFVQMTRRLLDEATYGADFLVRMHNPGGSFYQSVMAPGPGKKPEDRRVTGPLTSKDTGLNVSYRAGGGVSIAALAMAARLPAGADFEPAIYLKAAEAAFVFLERHNLALCNDGKENIVDDYCGLMAATELYRTTCKQIYAQAANRRAESLMARLIPGKGYWRADAGDRPFFHAADAGLPVVSLLAYAPLAEEATRSRILETVRMSLEHELELTGAVPNPFGLARQIVQGKDGQRSARFFFPHDTEAAPWWQGENARLASLAAAARLAAPFFGADSSLQTRLRAYADDQLNWILGLNPFDACMLQGHGRNNPEYMFFSSYQYTNAPGGIVNGVTSGYKNDQGIDFNVFHAETGQDWDWRWGEQWLPHSAWYMLAVAAGQETPVPERRVIIGYIFPQDQMVKPATIAAEKLSIINYAFSDIRDGVMVEGFKRDAENFRLLHGLKARNPELKVLVSVGGWTWSGAFSDMALTKASRRRFIDSVLPFLKRHRLDGLDLDWEYPGLKGIGNRFRPEDKANFTALLRELRAAFDAATPAGAPRLLLTIAVGAMDECIEQLELGKISQTLDYINLMTYDQSEAESDPIAAHHAPLFIHPDSPKAASASTSAEHFIAAGVPPHKLVMGVPFYGHAWAEVGPANYGLHQMGKNPQPGIFAGFRNLKAMEGKDGFLRHWDDLAKAPFLYNIEKRLFISYEDEQSLREKCRFIQDRGLGGVMFWEYNADHEGRLLDTLYRELHQKK